MKKDFSLYSYKWGKGLSDEVIRLNSLPFCKFCIPEGEWVHVYSCAMIRAKKEIMLADFRETNRSDDVEKMTGKKDPAFEGLKKQIESFIEQCPHWRMVPFKHCGDASDFQSD